MGTYLAVDLGATSGRVIAGELAGGRLELREVHRFENRPVETPGGLRWDVDRLFADTLDGLTAACASGPPPDGVAVDTWGVDYGLVDAAGRLLEAPEHYRGGTAEAQQRLEARVAPAELFARTGVLPQQINTVFRLGDTIRRLRPEPGTTVLLTPDLWTFWLGGERGAERTIAGTTGLLAAGAGEWDTELAAAAGIDPGLLPAVVEPGTRAGTLLPELAARVGAEIPVLRVAGHDTASAVAAVPGEGHVAFVSCGTWALAGVEHDRPVLTERARELGFTNEAGFAGRTRLNRNLTGLWLLEEALREWSAEGLSLTRADVLRAAEETGPVEALVDVASPEFLAPGGMVGRVRAACERAGRRPPETPGEFTRCVLQSLAAGYRAAIDACVELTGRPVEAVHVVGGGSRIALLCRLTAEACERPVLAGPAEATSVGNVLVQALAAGELGSLEEVRAVVRRSVEVVRYEPEGSRVS
jgi:rhamnulokinase